MYEVTGAVAAVLLLMSTGGSVFYVMPGGSDSADGSASHPWATIQHAADAVHPGDTVHVAPGLYRQAIVTRASGRASARIRFVSDTPWGALVRTTGQEYSWTNLGSYVDIQGFDISGDGRVGILNLASYVRVVGNHVHDLPATNAGSNGGAGIDNGNYSARQSDIIGNVVHDIGSPENPDNHVHGIYIANYGGRVVNNITYRNQAWGIHAWHAATNAVIANNLVFANGQGGIIVGAGDAPGGVTADRLVVSNNIVVHNKRYGISEAGRCGPHNRYLNNLVYANEQGAFRLQHGLVALGTVAADPEFVDFRPDGKGDYHLTAGSPAMNAGTPLGAPDSDLDGVARPQGTGFDIGPYEYRAASSRRAQRRGSGNPPK